MIYYIARQPILDQHKKLFAYELLFRDGQANSFPEIDSDEATSRLIDNSEFSSGISAITANHKAFINFTETSICQGLPEYLPKHSTVVELLETVTPSEQVLNAIKGLHSKGYCIALDDFEYDPKWEQFLPYVNIIKMDFRLMSIGQIKQQMKLHKGFNGIYLAEKVETYDEFHQALEMGFKLFQGYFFAKPEVIQRRALSVSENVYFELLEKTSAEHFEPDEIAKIVERDTGVSYKLLRFVNSAFFTKQTEICSLKQAVIRLGQAEVRKFVAIIATAALGAQKPDELTRLAITRARFFEQLALANSRYGADSNTAFLAGLLSNLDAIMDCELKPLLEDIHASTTLIDALLHRKGPVGVFLAAVCAIEQIDWQAIDKYSAMLHLPSKQLMDYYQDAAVWAVNLHSSQ